MPKPNTDDTPIIDTTPAPFDPEPQPPVLRFERGEAEELFAWVKAWSAWQIRNQK
jgi:hypothetical protein